jgi:ribose/xylose/arabinose/galactoside ABC-type transport system permease subunit
MTTSSPGPSLTGRLQNFSVLLVLAVLCVYLSIATDNFATFSNVQNVLQQVSVIGIIAMGMTMLLVSGAFDLSVGGQVALTGVVIAKVANASSLGVALVAAVVLGLALGLVNGLIVTRLRVNSLVATLGSGLAFGGVAFLLSGSAPIVLEDDGLQNAMTTTVAGFPVPVYLFLAVVLVSAWFLHGTVGGRRLFALGANEDAARYAGVPVDFVRVVPFVVTGLWCGLAAIILTGLLASAQPDVGSTYPLQVIAASVVGGVSISGGRGTVGMAVVGVLLIGVVSNGFNLLGLDSNYQNVFTGVIVIVAVAVDSALRRQAERSAVARQRERRGLDDAASRSDASNASL